MDFKINEHSYLCIQNFMGGTLKLPMKPKMKLLEINGNFRDMTALESFKCMVEELYQDKKAREILRSYGAMFEKIESEDK